MSEEFLNQNKEAIIEEMGQSIQTMSGYLNEILTSDAPPEADSTFLRTIMIAMGHQLGYLTALYNQYYVITNGEVPKSKPIGFGALTEKEKK